MPIYEYRCTTCGETIEVLQRVSEGDRDLCGEDCARDSSPEAGQGSLVRQLALTGGYAMGGARGPAASPESCGHCGMKPGSCAE